MNYKKHILKNKNFKLGYYINTGIREWIPDTFFYNKRKSLFANIKDADKKYLYDRVNYYNKLSGPVSIQHLDNLCSLRSMVQPAKAKVYYHDIRKYLKYFKNDMKYLYMPGDNISTLPHPAFVKSRPINSSENEIIIKLNAIRHFNFIKDDIPFHQKKDVLFGRLAIYQEVRKKFFQAHFHNPVCDIGDVAHEMKSQWMKPKVSIAEHLKYKFILALEGNDVATNLKWIMSSNSIAVMPMPRYETWFMEGRLIPDVHFICIKDDFSDLNEKLAHYSSCERESRRIIENAQKWVSQFKDSKRELLLNLMVMDKYFMLTQ